MKVTLLPSSFPAAADDGRQYVSTYLVNDTVAVDAGSVGLHRTPQDQAKIRHVLLTHSHIDHTAALAMFVENAYEAKKECVVVHGSQPVLDSLQQDVFNNRLWPDFIALSNQNPNAPFMKFERLDPGKAIQVEGLTVTPVNVHHVVPTMAFLIDDGSAAVAIITDTGPTDEIWNVVNANPRLKAVYLEATFPNNLQWLADVSKHLTPATFAQELKKLQRPVPVYAIHLKARYQPQVAAELRALNVPNLDILQSGKTYTF